MFCKSCGKEIAEDSIFCNYCGIRQMASTHDTKRRKAVSVEIIDRGLSDIDLFSIDQEILEEINLYLPTVFKKYIVGQKIGQHRVYKGDGLFELDISFGLSNEMRRTARRYVINYLLEHGFIRASNDTFDKVIEL